MTSIVEQEARVIKVAVRSDLTFAERVAAVNPVTKFILEDAAESFPKLSPGIIVVAPCFISFGGGLTSDFEVHFNMIQRGTPLIHPAGLLAYAVEFPSDQMNSPLVTL